ncbi:MAG: ABC transporter permease [Acidobacteriales bacterium]|nr:ABC transporter permease [Terriglobales bacterium]
MDILLQDIRQTLRMLRKRPGFTLVAVLTLALGIGANTAIFSLVKAVVLRALPFEEPQQLYRVWTHLPSFGKEAASLPDYRDWRDQNTVFEGLAAYNRAAGNFMGGSEPERVTGSDATLNLFSVLKVKPAAGRLFAEGDANPSAPKVAVLSYSFWQRHFGGRADVIGQGVTLNITTYTIIGVAPPEVQHVIPSDVFLPLALTSAQEQQLSRRSDFLEVIGRAKPGVRQAQIEAQMNTIAHRLAQKYPDTNTGVGIEVNGLQRDLLGDMRPMLFSLWGAVAFMLLIVCVNLASLMLARGAARQREMAIRVALGAKSGRLVRQLITEGLVRAALGGAVGILLATWGTRAALAFAPKDLPFASQVTLDYPVLGFAALLAVVSGVLFTLIPALQGRRVDVNAGLKQDRGAGESAHHQLRRVLVISEVALSLILLAGAGLMLRTLDRLHKTAPGFAAEHLLTFRASVAPHRYGEEQQTALFDRMLSGFRALPGVSAAAAANDLYVADEPPYLSFNLQGAPPLPPGHAIDAQVRSVTPGFFETLNVPLLRGRSILDSDDAKAPKVAVVNQALADRYFPGQELVGRSVTFDGKEFRQIVGVTANVKQQGVDQEVYPEIDLPYTQSPSPGMTFALRTQLEPQELVAAARNTIHNIDSTAPMYQIQTMDEILGDNQAPRRFQTALLASFAGLALLLAAIGIYGVMAQSVTQRTPEFGIRMALGAHPAQVLRLVLTCGLQLTLLGLGFGVAGALLLTRFLHSFLFGVSAYDPATLIAVSLVLAATAMLACYIPARRAMDIDPMAALRQE